MKNFPGGPRTPFFVSSLSPRFSLPQYEFRSDGPALGPDSADSVTIDELESIQAYELALDSVCRVPEAAIAALSSARRLLERQNRTETTWLGWDVLDWLCLSRVLGDIKGFR